MPEYLAPGVYVEEVDTGSKPIEGVSTSTSGMVGVTERGPENVATLVTSFGEFRRQFGGYLDYRKYKGSDGEGNWYLPHAVEGFFNNRGKRVYIVRVLPDGATFAEVCINVLILNAAAVPLGGWQLNAAANAGDRQLTLNNVNNLSPGMWLQVDAGAATQECVYVADFDGAANTVTLDQPLRSTHANGAAVNEVGDLIVRAIDRGRWGDELRVTVKADLKNDSLLVTQTLGAAAVGAATLTLRSAVGVEAGSVIEVNYDDTTTPPTPGQFYKVTTVNRISPPVVTISPALTAAVADKAPVRTREFSMQVDLVQTNPLTLQTRTIESETHRRLATDPQHSRYFVKVLGPIPTADTPLRADKRTDGESDWVRVAEGLTRPNAVAAIRTGPADVSSKLDGGSDDELNIIADTYIGDDAVNPQDRTGLFELKNIEEVSIVSIPGRTSQAVQEAVINHCELMRYRCAVLDSQEDDGMAEVQEHRGLYDTKYAALYYPWLKIPDPFPENPQARGTVLIPPSGHIMGIYARSDIERGVHKAPANEVIRGISDLEVKLTKEQQDILNPRNINALRNFRDQNRGLRVWGARVLSSDPDWKYVNVRRLFIFVEHSIDQGTQWVVFEPNNEDLWARVRRVITAFLTNVWRDGALMGTTPEEGFFVKCDRTTMTQNDLDNGRLIVEVGLAVTKPAEFVIFRIGQWANGSMLEEGA